MMVYTCATASNWLGEAAMPVRSPSRVNDGIGSDLNVTYIRYNEGNLILWFLKAAAIDTHQDTQLEWRCMVHSSP